MALACAVVIANACAFGQTVPPGTVAAPAPTVAAQPVSVKTGFDLVRLRSDQMTIPLRFGHILAGTERLDLDGRALVAGKDYALNAGPGTISLLVARSDGALLRISYQYDSAAKSSGVFGGSDPSNQSINGIKLQFGSGATGTIGLGIAERLDDGTTMISNVFGFNHSFNLGGVAVKGGVFVGQRQKNESSNMFGDKQSQGNTEYGQGIAFVQSLSSKMFGGHMTADYQDIDDRFTAYSALNIEGQSTESLAKEHGLKRSALGLTDAHLLGGTTGFGFRRVGDENGGLTWRSAGYAIGGLKLAWNQTAIDQSFSRFADLRESDHDQLAKERGLTRETFGLASKSANFDSTKVQGVNGQGFYRNHVKFDSNGLTLSVADQKVDNGFNRFGDLREDDRNQLAREAGIAREDIAFGFKTLNLTRNEVRSDNGILESTTANAKFGSLTLGYGHNSVSSGFDKIGSLAPTDVTNHASAALRILDPNLKLQGQDNGAFGNGLGLERTGLHVGLDLGHSREFGFNRSAITYGAEDLRDDKVTWTSPGFKASFAGLTATPGFSGASKVLFTEQQNLGVAPGLSKQDFSIEATPKSGKTFAIQNMTAHDLTGEASRLKVSLENGPLGLTYSRRDVSQTFSALPTMVDPEKDLLTTLMGQSQSEFGGHWTINPRLALEGNWVESFNANTNTGYSRSRDSVTFGLDKTTSIKVSSTTERTGTGTEDQHDAKSIDLGLSKEVGKIGKVELEHAQWSYKGSQDTTPDAVKDGVKVTAKISATTNLTTEHAVTKFSDGTKEQLTANTVSTALNSRLSVSVTDSHTERDADKPSETHRDVGVAVDFGKGIKLSVGMARQLTGPTTGTLTNQATLSGGEAQGVKLDSASYIRNGWDDTRDQHVGKISFTNAKPFEWGFMKDVRFHYLADTSRDFGTFQKEDRNFGFGANLGHGAFDFTYSSQIAGDGYRAIDRTVKLTTDRTGKDKIRFNVLYGTRTMPTDDLVAIRDYSLSWQIQPGLLLQHSVVTNPLQQQGGVLLGNVPVDERRNDWTLKFDRDPKHPLEATYRETLRDRLADAIYREALINYTLFADNPSPLHLSYGLVQWERNGVGQTSNKFSISYTQRPGPNQSLSLALENMNFEQSVAAGYNPQNWVLRLDFFSRH